MPRAWQSPLLLALLVLAWALPVSAQQVVATEYGGAMKYLANAADPGVGDAWKNPSFDDSAWLTGTFGVGYETGGVGASNLIQTDVSAGTYSIYVRVHFTVDEVAQVSNLFLGADYDDGYVAWINGVEVFRSPEIPGGPLDWDTPSAVGEASNQASPVYDSNDISTVAIPELVAGDNVLSLAVFNAAPSSSDLVLVPQLIVNKAVGLARGPYLQQGSPDSVRVRWRTALPQGSRVDYGTQLGNLSESVTLSEEITEHAVELAGLTPDTRYYYAIGSPGELLVGDDEDHSFVTAPPAGSIKPTRIWVLGDSGTGTPSAFAVRDAYANFNDRDTDLWLMLGDNAYPDGTDSEYQANLFDVFGETLRTSVLWPTLGNHDGISSDSATQSGPYYDIFDLPGAGQAGGLPSGTEAYYSFDYANIHFVVLDSHETDRLDTGEMVLWLGQDLAATNQDWIIAYWHHPPFSKGSHDSDLELPLVEMRQNVVPVLEDHGVDLVLNGHSHSYERSFFIDGHYGDSASFDSSMQVQQGDGRPTGDGAYTKPDVGPTPHQGTVYTVAGCSGSIVTSSPLNHPAMYTAMAELGSLVLDVDGTRLDLQFLSQHGEVLDSFSILKGCADQDQDGICADEDNCLDVANTSQENTDGDALGDACDDCPDDPANVDPDGDMACGPDDNCPDDPNPLQEDLDGDGVGDACDVCPLDFEDDEDMDGFCESDDNCPGQSNGSQSDGDVDGLGDVCDPCPADPDNDLDADGYCGNLDNCPATFNVFQRNFDGDGPGDACDICPLDPANDADADSFCGDKDNCPSIANSDQRDDDADGTGDLCDPCPADPDNDFDGDGLCEDADNCPNLASTDQSDNDGDGIGDLCDVIGDTDGDGFFDETDNCPLQSNPAQRDADGDGDGDRCDDDDDNDGITDGGDCAAGIIGVSEVPGAIGATLILTDPVNTNLGWSRATQGHTSNVYRGFAFVGQPLDQLTCFDSENPGTESQDDGVPPAGSLFYYIVTGYNACGEGRPGGAQPHPRLPLPTCPPRGADTDVDGIPDLEDNCTLTANSAQSDFDDDHVGDLCDNCPTIDNPGQSDADFDGQGDACEGQVDADGDGIPDASDNCPEDFNVDQRDADEDGAGDVCDTCPLDPEDDLDQDGICADLDNCPTDANPQQTDTDQDALGNACDNDDDNDGVDDPEDEAPLDANACRDIDNDTCDDCSSGIDDVANDGVDSDGDGRCDPGDPDDDNDGVVDTQDNAPLDPNACRDADGDTCDDCSSGIDDDANDGIDTDDDGLCNDGDPDDDNDGVDDTEDSAPLDPNACRDADTDTCDDCTGGAVDIANDGLDTDGDGQCDLGDLDDDNDGVNDTEDNAPLDPNACRDADTDTCDDCANGVDNIVDDGLDTDGDGQCDLGDLDDDNDGVNDTEDNAPLDPNACRDADTDTCDDCANGADNIADDGLDSDGDGQCDLGDPDDDNDGVNDTEDNAPLDPNACRDADTDTCDDCTSGADNINDDGLDTDADGLCDEGDLDDDNDGVDDTEDNAPLDPNACRDSDADTCDDCTSGADDIANDGLDTDGDGQCDLGDPDDDNDGVGDTDDNTPLDPNACRDADTDTCDDCTNGSDDIANDGLDTDGDGQCDLGDPDDDNDGVGDLDDNDPLNATVCLDDDTDTCDDCSSGVYNPSDDGTDTDGDGQCDLGDADDDNDGVGDLDDADPLNATVCADDDADSCDDCSGGVYNPSDDGTDSDGDGLCDTGDPDDDNDGVPDGSDADSLNAFVCSDTDADTCDDCSGGTFDPSADGIDTDADGLCDDGDTCDNDPLNDEDGDGFCGDMDNCPLVANPGQEDSDSDGVGDVCDCVAQAADDFEIDGAPPPGWVIARGNWSATGGQVAPDGGAGDASMYFDQELCTSDHWALVALTVVGTENGVALRQVAGDLTARRYAAVYDETGERFRWLSCDGGCSVIASSPDNSVTMSDGDVIGALVTGTGGETVLSVWKNPVGPDPLAWGTPDWMTEEDPSAVELADTGRSAGIYAERSTNGEGAFDDFKAGSAPPPTP